MPYLYRVHADGTVSSGHQLCFKPLVVGRSRSVDITISEDLALSHEHFSITPARSGTFIRDLGSTNGTWVNGRRVRERLLLPYDHIRAGHSHFTLEPGLATMLNELSDLVIIST